MKKSSKYAVGITSVVLAGTLAVGTAASAWGGNGNGNGNGGGRGGQMHQRLTDEQRCTYQDQIVTSMNLARQQVTDRIANLESWRAQAQANGDTALVARLDRRLARLHTVLDRAERRAQAFQTWVGEHCDA